MENNKKIILLVGMIMMGVLGIYNFVLDYPEKIDVYINGEKITLSKDDENKEVNLVTLFATRENKVEVKGGLKNSVRVNGEKISPFKENEIGKIDINENNQIKLDVKFKGNNNFTTYYLNTLPTNFLDFEVENNGDEYDGIYYFTSYTADQSTSYVFNTNSDGDVLYYKKCEGFCQQFRKETSSDGKARYVYTAQDLTYGAVLDMNNIYGKLVVMDENYKVIDEVQYIENERTNNDKTYTIFEYIDDEHYLITTSSREKTNSLGNLGELTLIENNIQEIKDNKVVFEWRSAEHKELYDYILDMNTIKVDEENDYIHINKVIVDPEDNNLIASFRNISTILKIDRKTGDIIWALGGKKDNFNLTQEQKFGYQHSLSFTKDHSLMIFDNGDNRPALGITTKSSVLKIKLDENNKKVSSYNRYMLDNVNSMAMGSVQVIDEENDVFLVCFGTGIFKKGPVQLIDFKNNKVLFSLDLKTTKMMMSAQKTN